MSGRLGGEIEFQSEAGDTRFEVRLPIKHSPQSS
jgi:nitrogen-specific signal transduction histidine kinase